MGAERRERLLVAARDLVTARGWDSVRMADVAEAAGVSRRIVHEEFDGKAALAEALAERELALFQAALARHGPAVAGQLAGQHANPLLHSILTGVDDLLPPLSEQFRTRAQLLMQNAPITEKS